MNRNFSIVKDFDGYFKVNESLSDGLQTTCNQIFAKGSTITFEDGTSVEPKDIVKVVDDALNWISSEYMRTYEFASRINIIFLRQSKEITTMAVDEHMNMYINAGFVYKVLKMKKEYVGAVIMHEILHVLLDHLNRGKNWYQAKGKPWNTETCYESNLAADLEVNRTLIKMDVIDEETLLDEIKGIYISRKNNDLGVVTMESTLGNDKYMEKLKEMCPKTFDHNTKEGKNLKTTEEWDKGYMEGWNKFAGLIKKYGYEKFWEKLQDAGIINAMGELDDVNVEDIAALEFLNVKSFDEYIGESKAQSDGLQTYDEGYMSAVAKIVKKLASAMDPSGGGGGGQGGPKTNVDTNVKRADLDDINIPSKGKPGKNNGENGFPDNFTAGSSEKGDDDNKNGDAGGEGKSDDELTDDDFNKLKNDLDKRSQGLENSGNNSDGSSNGDMDSNPTREVGGTGTFKPSEMITDKVLKNAGYSDEDISKINGIRKKNEERNSEKGIEAARKQLRARVGNSDLGRLLDVVEVEAGKYKNIWRKIMEEFLSNKTRNARQDVEDVSINWKKKSRIALGELGPQYNRTGQDPQDINLYVDVSGSVDMKLLEVICKSLVIFTEEYQYSAMNICPWATTSNGIHRVDDFDRDEKVVTDEIIQIVSKSTSQCGGGTDVDAAISAMVDNVVLTLNNEEKEAKDDVHVVITDGQFDYRHVESKIFNAVKDATKNFAAAELAPKHTFWMIYDANENLIDAYKKEIKKGTVIFINSSTVIGNG